MTSGIIAKGIPNDSSTWLRTSAREGSKWRPITKRAGTMVIARRRKTEILRRMKPCMTTWPARRSEEHTSELQSRFDLVCRLLLEKKKAMPAGQTLTSKAPHADGRQAKI